MKPKPKDITFHYTNKQMVKDLMKLIPFEKGDIALDAGSGKNKVWQKNCPVQCLECEIEDGVDFMEWDKHVDWVIGNPPYGISEPQEIANAVLFFLEKKASYITGAILDVDGGFSGYEPFHE